MVCVQRGARTICCGVIVRFPALLYDCDDRVKTEPLEHFTNSSPNLQALPGWLLVGSMTWSSFSLRLEQLKMFVLQVGTTLPRLGTFIYVVVLLAVRCCQILLLRMDPGAGREPSLADCVLRRTTTRAIVRMFARYHLRSIVDSSGSRGLAKQ